MPNKDNETYFTKARNATFTFAFVCVWHGIQFHILLWVLLNYLGFFVEMGLNTVTKSNLNKNYLMKYIGQSGLFRINALIGASLWIPAMLNNFMLLSGFEHGLEFFKRTYVTGGTIVYSVITVAMYCLYIVADSLIL